MIMVQMNYRQNQTHNKWLNDELNVLAIIKQMFDEFDNENVSSPSLHTLLSEVSNKVENYLKEQYGFGFLGALYVIEGEVEDFKKENIKFFTDAIVFQRLNEIVGDKTFYDRIEEITNEANIENLDEIHTRFENIVRSDGHRMVLGGKYDALVEINEAGTNVYKTWCGIPDESQRITHGILNGTTIPINDYFKTVNGMALKPGGFGVAEEDCNCRCWIIENTGENKSQDGAEEDFETWLSNYTTSTENAAHTQKMSEYEALNERANKLLAEVI